MKILFKSLKLIILLMGWSGVVLGQSSQDSTLNNLANRKSSELIPHIKIYKLKSGKTFTIAKNQHVRVYCVNTKNGNGKIKSAVVSEIMGHQIILIPDSKAFDEITVTDSTLNYIAFTTISSVARGITVNTLHLAAVVIIVVIVVFDVFFSIFNGGKPAFAGSGAGSDFIKLRWDDFHKHTSA